jgi:Immunoglobulin-like domain of bacterial spore germination/Sporulation and spore germination
MKRFVSKVAPLFVGLSLLGVACGGSSGGSLGPGPTGSASPGASPSVPPTGSQEPSETPSSNPSSSPSQSPSPQPDFTFEVWFLSSGHLFVTHRTEPFVPAVAGLALQALGVGPTSVEAGAGVSSAIPDGVAGRVSDLSGGTATVDLDPAFFEGNADTLRQREAQVVYTLSQYATISKVTFTSNGSAVDDGSWTRSDFEDLLPAILAESPLIGDRVSSPVTVSGTANVFEATVSLRILDENGDEIARTFTTATCGTGCRGDYSVAVAYSVDHEQAGTIEVFESSAQDGSMINVVDIPVTLTP